jgi:uncharacterized protein (TIGR00369 family)
MSAGEDTTGGGSEVDLQVGFVELIGLRITEVQPDRAVGSLQIGPDLFQPYGILHGGVLCSIVETLASIGAAAWYGEQGQVVGVSNSTDFIRATRSGTLTGVATPIHRGRTSQLWLVEIREADDRLVARGQVRIANLEGPAPAPSG